MHGLGSDNDRGLGVQLVGVLLAAEEDQEKEGQNDANDRTYGVGEGCEKKQRECSSDLRLFEVFKSSRGIL